MKLPGNFKESKDKGYKEHYPTETGNEEVTVVSKMMLK